MGENAFGWMIKNGGINTEEDYPYEGRDKSCRFDENKPTYTISAYHEINEQDEDDLTEKIATEGPISVAVDAGKFSFQLYHSGVYYEPACSSTRLNHGVLAFSTTGSMEGALAKANGELVSLSEQNLVDCDPIDSGCNGGLMENAFGWMIKNGGINTEEDYPYEGRDKSCRFDANKPTYTISSYSEINEQDEDDLTEKIATEGPISVAIDAGKFSFQLYHSGVYYEPACSSTRLNHGVLAFG